MTKKKYYDLADQEKNRYLVDLNNFYLSNPNEVIQNKTKKNHIKKPCSAYAIYLKESKTDIKQENPDLKMADILKVVAERWRNLADIKRSEFQRKAAIEKEETQIKINQQNGIEEMAAKKDTSKKSSSNPSKRGQKAVAEPKIDSMYSTEQRTDTYESYEEPNLSKHQALNIAFPGYFPNPQEINYRTQSSEGYTMLDMTLSNQGLRLPQTEYFQFPRFNDYSASNLSNLLNYLPQSMFKQNNTEKKVQEPTIEEMYVKDEYVSYDEEDTEPHTTATNTTPKSGNVIQAHGSQEAIVDDFKLDDDFGFDRTLENFGNRYNDFF